MSEAIDQLSREERRRRVQLLREHRRETGKPPVQAPIPRQGGGGPYPLSFAQQRLWFLDQLEPGLTAYNISHALRLTGRLDLLALARSLAEIVRRHESLRTTFALVDGEPAQVIGRPGPVNLPVIDLAGLPEAAREPAALRLATEEVRRPFDLARGPLLRTVLLRMGPEERIVLFVLHHIVADGWSLGLFIRELMQLYAGFASGRPPSLPELPIQYGDFARWQRQWLEGPVLAAQIDYWRRRLAGPLPSLLLPTDHAHPAVRTYRGAHRGVGFSAGLAESLRRLGRSQGATPFMTLLGAVATLLHRYSGQDDLLIGSPVTHRNRVETEGLIGFFVNTVVLRIDLSGNPPFLRLLERVRETALGAYSHQDLPFERLVEELQPDRDLSRSPLFQVLMTVESSHGAAAAALELPDLALTPVPAEVGTARIDLGLELTDSPSGLYGVLEYSTELFEAPTLERLVAHLDRLLQGIALNPELRLSDLPLLDAGEWHQVVRDGNDTRREWTQGRSLHELFLRQAERTPDAPAALSDQESLTYGELARRAGDLARQLRRMGVAPESRVAVCVERAPSALVALLGVLAAGGAYVPLDPESPRERLQALLADAGAGILVTQRHLAPRLAGLAGSTVPVEDANGAAGGSPAVLPVEPDHAAYVVYTSGSTGTPKGVIATHRGAVNFVHGIAGALELGPGDRLLLFAPLAFDASVLQIFPTLTRGAALVIHPQPRELSARDVLELCARHKVTVLDLPAALWRQWVEDVAASRLPLPGSLRAFLTGGESVPAARLRTWASLAAPGAAFLSSYGPTEATVTTTVWQTTGAEATALEAPQVPIGRPLPNTRAYVVDRALRPAPLGVAGELVLGGAGLARGYLGRPDWTAEAFVPDPLGGEPGGRLYRTGDLARRRAGGELEFLGRADGQVKIRGFRIEPGEVEAALARHPAVRQAVVAVREDRPGDLRLAAYVVGDDGSAGALAEDLRPWLAERLPEPMLPSSVTVLERLPVLPSGKVDRRALPAPAPSRSTAADEFAAPRNPVEQVLAAVWEDTLGIERVGVRDHFFALGGHSLLATRVVTRVRAALGVDLPLRALFEEPTVAGLAARIEALRQAGSGDARPPLVPVPRGGRLPLSFAQQRLWFLHQLDPASPAYNMPFAFRLSGPLAVPALAASLSEVVARHETLRTTLALQGEEPAQQIAPPAPQPLPVLDLAGLPEAAREELALRLGHEEAMRPFDLARPPVVRTLLLRLSESDHILLFTIHHVSGDGWSVDVLTRELAELYAAASAGRPARLPRLPVQYADFAVWQRS
ncbi:MAG TPA: amino acid adenylation domain-containing protein, partial [Thermoanaerobaculia bacterium]|nr:amino acid adenylation domain-containing protein [Thermoanaerobaculia bacterium]